MRIMYLGNLYQMEGFEHEDTLMTAFLLTARTELESESERLSRRAP